MKRETRQRIKSVHASIEQALEPLGFKRLFEGKLIRRHSEDIVFKIGFPHVARPFIQEVEINANLGIWCEQIEAKCAEIVGSKRTIRGNATVLKPLYVLANKSSSHWEFIEEEASLDGVPPDLAKLIRKPAIPFDVVAADIAEAVRKHGLPWFLERGTLRELVHRGADDFLSWEVTLPVGYRLLGQLDKARQTIARNKTFLRQRGIEKFVRDYDETAHRLEDWLRTLKE